MDENGSGAEENRCSNKGGGGGVNVLLLPYE